MVYGFYFSCCSFSAGDYAFSGFIFFSIFFLFPKFVSCPFIGFLSLGVSSTPARYSRIE
jgi:hypothetical protein